MLEPGSKLGAAGLNEGPFLEKLNSDLERIDPPNPEGLNAGALALKVVFFVAGVDVAELLNAFGTKGLAFSECKPKFDDEKMPGLNVALGFALGLNSLASTLKPENDNVDEWLLVEDGFGGENFRLKVGSLSH